MNKYDMKNEVDQRIEVLKRTASECTLKAKQLELLREKITEPPVDIDALDKILKKVDDLLNWRFVNPLGYVVIDADMLSLTIDVDTLRVIRVCIINEIERMKTDNS